MNRYTPALDTLPTDAPKAIRELVERQARAWEGNDFELAAGDWHPDGVLVSPGGAWPIGKVREEMRKLHDAYRDLVIEVKNVFTSKGGHKLALEWDWTVTRKADGLRGTTPDAIIADLKDGKILSWREYFDLCGSVEGGV